ncbi:YraN family protein [Sungkyunkwania multivorans]|uniref:UPF0102 protein ACFQ1M_11645 n=1 Tax=Sungkyunkwania multivorans TaxID=1173618 RepID=A0ABW3D061_9FLAO
MAWHNEIGKIGEKMAAEHLQKQGYQILERNYIFDKAEVDIIAQKHDILVAVEVKLRSTTDFGNPQDFVSKKKIKLMVKATDHYVVENDLDVEVRFDIIAISVQGKKFSLQHLEDAFLYF